ncbi:MAG: crossover junction endodeoxyribonuclease RuvC [Patescibacteria group bacterium]
MRVIGVDPGYDRVGVAVIEYGDNHRERLIFSTCIETDRKTALPDRLHAIGTRFQQLIVTYTPTTLAMETLFFNKNQKTALGVAEARGMLLHIAKAAELQIYEFSPQEVKVATTGYGNSDKKAVTEMVKRLVPGAPATALDDEYDAIAVGVTCLAHHGRNT